MAENQTTDDEILHDEGVNARTREIAQHLLRILATKPWIAPDEDFETLGLQYGPGEGPIRKLFIDVSPDGVAIYAPLREPANA